LGDLDISDLDDPQTEHAIPEGDVSRGSTAPEDTESLNRRIKQLEEQLSTVSQEFSNYQKAVLLSLGRPLSEGDLAATTNEKPEDPAKPSGDSEPDVASGQEKPNEATAEKKSRAETKDDDYFDAYSYNGRILGSIAFADAPRHPRDHAKGHSTD
jgi:hypothetical protein